MPTDPCTQEYELSPKNVGHRLIQGQVGFYPNLSMLNYHRRFHPFLLIIIFLKDVETLYLTCGMLGSGATINHPDLPLVQVEKMTTYGLPSYHPALGVH